MVEMVLLVVSRESDPLITYYCVDVHQHNAAMVAASMYPMDSFEFYQIYFDTVEIYRPTGGVVVFESLTPLVNYIQENSTEIVEEYTFRFTTEWYEEFCFI